MKKNDFVEYVVEDLLAGLDGARAKAMFGGYGLYAGDKMFGIIVDDVLYFKTDGRNRPDYEKEGSQPFSYRVKGRSKPVIMSYWEVPARIMDDREEAVSWARAACRANSSAKRKKLQRK